MRVVGGKKKGKKLIFCINFIKNTIVKYDDKKDPIVTTNKSKYNVGCITLSFIIIKDSYDVAAIITGTDSK